MPDSLLTLPLAALCAILLDRLLGEVPRWHPLVGFGHWAAKLETTLNRSVGPSGIVRGVLAWSLAVLPWVGLAIGLRAHLSPFGAWCLDVLLLYFALGAQSLREHAEAIAIPLMADDLPAARQRLSWIVSRDTSTLNSSDVAKGAVESVLENGHDAIFGALFWFSVGGGPAVLLFRLANTLDAMWGYRTPRFNHFGRFAARTDDVLGFLSSRLTALTYALCGQTRRALRCWRTQAPQWDSPNAGPVMSAGAGSLGLQLGGGALYHGQWEARPTLGEGRPAEAPDIARALRLPQRGVALWIGVSWVLSIGLA